MHQRRGSTGRRTMRTPDQVLSRDAASQLSHFKLAVESALPDVEKLILFGSRARGEARPDSDYDVAVVVRDLSDRRRVRRIPLRSGLRPYPERFLHRPIP